MPATKWGQVMCAASAWKQSGMASWILCYISAQTRLSQCGRFSRVSSRTSWPDATSQCGALNLWSARRGIRLTAAVVREQMSSGAEFAFCSRCGEKILLPKADKPIQLTKRQAEEVEANRRAADQRSRFEQVLFRLK